MGCVRVRSRFLLQQVSAPWPVLGSKFPMGEPSVVSTVEEAVVIHKPSRTCVQTNESRDKPPSHTPLWECSPRSGWSPRQIMCIGAVCHAALFLFLSLEARSRTTSHQTESEKL